MPTEVVKIVDPDNGPGTDYTSLSAWEAGEQRDLVTADEIAVAKCRCTSGSADGTAGISGWTTDSTRYVKIWTDPDENYRHPGKWDATKYRLEGSNTYVLRVDQPYTKIIGIQIKATNSGSNTRCVYANYSADTEMTFDKCIFKGAISGGSGTLHGLYVFSGDRTKVSNCVAYHPTDANVSTRGFYFRGKPVSVYNCTAYNCDYGFKASYGGLTVKNCLTQSCTDGFGGATDESDYNCSDISGDAPGANSVTGTVTFVDAANEDFHLDASDTVAKDAGTDLSSDPYLPFTDDIDGETRSAPWDIGADEYVSGGGATITIGKGSMSITPQSLYLPEQYIVGDGSLVATGKNLYSNLAMLIESATTTLSGGNIKINERIHIEKASTVLTGLNVIIGGAVGIGKATLIAAGKTLKINEAIAITKGALSIVGKSIQIFQSTIIIISKAVSTLTGKAFKANETIKIAVANCVAQGRNLYVNGEAIARKLIKIIGSAFKKIVGG